MEARKVTGEKVKAIAADLNLSVGCLYKDQLEALGLVTNAVVLWNTIYIQSALDHLRAQGETLNDEDIARFSPLCHGHINMLGHYSFTLAGKSCLT